MLSRIASFEFRYQIKNPILWIAAALTFLAPLAAMGLDVLQEDATLLKNSSFETLNRYLIFSIFYMFLTTAFVSNIVLRDDETGFGSILRSSPITKFEYLVGRFIGAFSVAALCFLLLPLGSWLGALMPWVDQSTVGPNRIADHLYGYFLLGLPNILISSAIFFTLATVSRSMMGTYLGVIVFLMLNLTLSSSLGGVVTPFGTRAFQDATLYWTSAERNSLLPAFEGALLYNRLLWIGISVLFLTVAYSRYSFADKGMSKRNQKKQKLAQLLSSDAQPKSTALMALPSATRGRAATWPLFWLRTKFEIKHVFKSPAFVLLMLFGLFTTLFALINDRDPDGRPSYPTTVSLIPELREVLEILPLIIVIIYVGELVWRERDRKMHEIIDTAPFPNWAYIVPKTAAVTLALLSVFMVSVVAAVAIQLSLGFTHLELDKYLLWYVLPMTYDMLLVTALAVFVQAISPHKFVGWGIMTLYVVLKVTGLGPDHNLLNYGGTPPVPLSDMNSASSFLEGPWVFRLYWGALAALLLVAAHLLWRRGTEVRLKPRLKRAGKRLTGSTGRIAGAALLIFATTGAYAYYNTNVLSAYETQEEFDAYWAEYEKKYFKYAQLPQPAISAIKLNVSLYPNERRAAIKGSYRLRNLTGQPIRDIHVRLADHDTQFGYRDLEFASATIKGARLVYQNTGDRYRIFRLSEPMQPGEYRFLNFETRRQQRGFPNGYPNTRLVQNGTYLGTNELVPVIGMNRSGLLTDPATRQKYGLTGDVSLPKLEDPSGMAASPQGTSWTTTDITVSTSADQTPLATGKKVSDLIRGGRRVARFVSNTPVRDYFSVHSSRYAEKHRQHRGIDLAVYYHPGHAWNVDRMLDRLQASLDRYEAVYGLYPFDHARIIEAPGYGNFAQAFPGTIPFTETLGFVMDYSDPETIDNVGYVTAHEMGHQYWGHQVVGAQMEGMGMVVETLASYSSLGVMKSVYGEDNVRRFLLDQLGDYLRARGANEVTLVRAAGAGYIHSSKGVLAMYLLEKRIGEDAVNRALRGVLNRYKFKAAPYARSVDFVEALRREALTPEQQLLITDLFERITLYDLRTDKPTAVRQADGKWEVSVPVTARKFYDDGNGQEKETKFSDSIEIGLFTAAPGPSSFSNKNVILVERQPIRSGKQVIKLVVDRKPSHAGIDPYNYYIDRLPGDNVVPIE